MERSTEVRYVKQWLVLLGEHYWSHSNRDIVLPEIAWTFSTRPDGQAGEIQDQRVGMWSQTCWADFQLFARILAKNVWAPSSSFAGCFLYAASYMMIMSLSVPIQWWRPNYMQSGLRRPRPRRTCIIALRVLSSVGLDSKTSSHSARASSTFCERTKARAFKDYSSAFSEQKHLYE